MSAYEALQRQIANSDLLENDDTLFNLFLNTEFLICEDTTSLREIKILLRRIALERAQQQSRNGNAAA